MYEVECAYSVVDGALAFHHDSDVPANHDDWCVLRVSFQIDEIFPAEASTGSAMDWSGDIATIEWRVIGDQALVRFRRLEGDGLEAARAFLLMAHGREMWETADQYVEGLFFGEAA